MIVTSQDVTGTEFDEIPAPTSACSAAEYAPVLAELPTGCEGLELLGVVAVMSRTLFLSSR
jgi:hypothetical protein